MKNLTKRKSKEPKAVLNVSEPAHEQQFAKGLDPEKSSQNLKKVKRSHDVAPSGLEAVGT
jgi:hypothetical protein